MQGGGYQDPAVTKKELVAWKGNVDSASRTSRSANPDVPEDDRRWQIKDVAELPVYFAKEVSEMVKGHGFSTLQAWEDGLKYATDASVFATDKTRVNFWETLYWVASTKR